MKIKKIPNYRLQIKDYPSTLRSHDRTGRLKTIINKFVICNLPALKGGEKPAGRQGLQFVIAFIIICNLQFVICNCLFAAFESRPPSARPLGMSASYVGLSNDTNAMYYNPAGLRLISAFEFSTTYNELFSVEGLQYNVFSAALPVENFGVAGISYSQFGPSEYKERTLILSNAISLAEGMMFGYNLKENFLKVSEYGSASALAVDLGFLARVSDNFAIGSSAKNINEPKIGVDKIPETYSAGIFLRPLKGVNFDWDIEKLQERPTSLHFGTEFRIFEFFCLRSGIQTNPDRFSFGFGFNRESLYFDYAYFTHPTLGADHIFTLSIKTSLEKEAVIEYKPKQRRARNPAGAQKQIEKVETEKLKENVIKININTASEDDIAALPDIGKVMAKRIVDYRTQKGLFKSIEEIQNVPRMSARMYEKIEGLITVADEVKPETK